MTDPSSPWARRPGSKAQSSISAFDTTAPAPQRPISRRKPNRPFCDEVCTASDLDGLSVCVFGGADLRLLDLLEVGSHGIK
jgi:hypothetical protein